ncbi:hypothetical protein CC86DRAFT_192265 [Ophiobolus disseminans]|uniref:Uncharacterized protein n=1 Tax=Ophiobolus disseminans TaxID=1469910 RepID=A0A6A7A6Y5_9PLEO|nr:hypothetical protein CC86DRAFT_192265 [Ophiobolus disseminans]
MAHHTPRYYFPTTHTHRHRPAEYDPVTKRWFQDDRKLPKLKSSYAFIWPKDGRMDSKLGRFKDILKNRGPDIYLTKNAHRLDYMANRPTRERWGGWTHLDDRDSYNSLNSKKFAPWVQHEWLGGREPGYTYDFRTRKYGVPNRRTWSDAQWPDSKKAKWPEAIRDVYGDSWQDRHWLPYDLSGPWRNSLGATDFMH